MNPALLEKHEGSQQAVSRPGSCWGGRWILKTRWLEEREESQSSRQGFCRAQQTFRAGAERAGAEQRLRKRFGRGKF